MNIRYAFMKKGFFLGLPISLQHLIVSGVTLTDVFMVGKLGDDAIAGMVVANQISFLMFILIYGVTSGGAVFTAQYWGAKQIERVQNVHMIKMLISLIFPIITFILYLLNPSLLLTFYTHDELILAQALSYYQYIIYSYFFLAITEGYLTTMRSCNKVWLPLFITCFTFVLNIGLNYVLIFGKMGFPMFGVAGAAIATTISRIVEVLLLISLTWIKKIKEVNFHRRYLEKGFLKLFLKTVTPISMHEAIWALGTSLTIKFLAERGETALAAFGVTDTFFKIAVTFFVGSSIAFSTIIGNTIGENRLDLAKKYANIVSIAMPVLGVFISIITISLYYPVFDLFFTNLSAEVRTLSFQLTVVIALYFAFEIFLWHSCLIFRSAGDTLFPLIVEALPLWVYNVPMLYVTLVIWEWPIILALGVSLLDKVLKSAFIAKRLISGKWLTYSLIKKTDVILSPPPLATE